MHSRLLPVRCPSALRTEVKWTTAGRAQPGADRPGFAGCDRRSLRTSRLIPINEPCRLQHQVETGNEPEYHDEFSVGSRASQRSGLECPGRFSYGSKGGARICGRGSDDPANRFEALRYEQMTGRAGYEPSSIRTQFFKDDSRTVISYNNSPDVGFDASLNPYRGCEHGCS